LAKWLLRTGRRVDLTKNARKAGIVSISLLKRGIAVFRNASFAEYSSKEMAIFSRGFTARTISLIISDGMDEHSRKHGNPAALRKFIMDLNASEDHIVAGMGVQHLRVNFHDVFGKEMGIEDKWCHLYMHPCKQPRFSLMLHYSLCPCNGLLDSPNEEATLTFLYHLEYGV
jgi:hypothetical protein